MKIVIDIDDNLYTRLFDNGVDNYDDAVDMAKAIRKGTPFPKGHGRLIEGDKLIEKIKPLISNKVIIEAIDTIITFSPTVIEADKEVENG